MSESCMKRRTPRQAPNAVTRDPNRSLAERVARLVRQASKQDGLLALLLIAGTIIAYLPVWHAGVIWDDESLVLSNPLIHRLDGLSQFWFSTQPVDYYPVTSTMLWVEWRLWGASPMGYHVVNVLLHAQAAHAFADEQRGPAALIQARAALNLFLKYQMDKRTSMFYANITRKLNDNGMKKAADALISEFGPRVAALPVGAASAAQKHGLLPTNCPQCGAPIHTDMASWVDSSTVECAYWGSQIRPE